MLVRLVHIVTIFNVMLSTTGVVLNRHFCQDQLQRVAFFVDASSCHFETTTSFSCHQNEAAACTHGDMHEDGCCHDDSQYLHQDDSQKVPPSISEWVLTLPVLSAILAPGWLGDLWVSAVQDASLHARYRPPDRLCPSERPALLQVFRC